MIAVPKHRYIFAAVSAVIFIISGILPLNMVASAVNWNVLMMLTGTMCTVSFFIDSKMPNRIADWLLNISPNVMWVAVLLSLFAGIVSAFVDNVATVLMIAPVGIALSKKLDISPVKLLICISVSSNLQGAATLVGDTTSILLGGYAGMNFMDFFFMNGKPSIFWAVEIGALVTIPIIMNIFRDQRQPVMKVELTEVEDYLPSILLILNILLLIAASFLPVKPENINGIICLAVAGAGFIHALKSRDYAAVMRTFYNLDYQTLILLAGLFIIIGGITEVGIIDRISALFLKAGGSSVFIMYTIIVWASVLISAFIDNIPYVAALLPVVTGIAANMGCSPILFDFGLLVGATLGGNITPVGASANIAAIGILRKNEYEVKNSDFLGIGLPFTLVAVLSGYLFCWFVWKP
ncbi:MAG: TRAP transporter large permease subunit [Lachnospiraceae bacterium]|nr:TRAP transporter large permease subunit [Lachnospiraceae bacterium]